jgi:hypothetical protein
MVAKWSQWRVPAHIGNRFTTFLNKKTFLVTIQPPAAIEDEKTKTATMRRRSFYMERYKAS